MSFTPHRPRRCCRSKKEDSSFLFRTGRESCGREKIRRMLTTDLHSRRKAISSRPSSEMTRRSASVNGWDSMNVSLSSRPPPTELTTHEHGARLRRTRLFMLLRWRPLSRSEEHTSELQSLMRISYAVFCLKKKKKTPQLNNQYNSTTLTTDQ